MHGSWIIGRPPDRGRRVTPLGVESGLQVLHSASGDLRLLAMSANLSCFPFVDVDLNLDLDVLLLDTFWRAS